MAVFATMSIVIMLLGILVDKSDASGGGFHPFGKRFTNFLRTVMTIQNQVQEKVVSVKENVRDNIGPNIEKMANVTADSAKEFVLTSKQIAAKVETTLGKITNVISENLVPEVRNTGQHLRSSMNKIVDTAERFESRARLSLDRFDEMVKNVGKNVNHGIDLIVVIICIMLFVLCNIVLKNCQTVYGTYELLSIMAILSLITGIAVLLRMFLTSVLQLELGSADIFKYCVLCPLAIVVGILVLKILWKIWCRLSIVVTFFLQVPGLVIYIAIAGPALWTWRAYMYSGVSKCKKPFILSITLPWNAILIWFIVFHKMVKSLRYDNETSFLTGLLIAYIYMYCNALYLFKYHQRPTVQQHLRHLYAGVDDGKKDNRLFLVEQNHKQRRNTKRENGRNGHQGNGRFDDHSDGSFGHYGDERFDHQGDQRFDRQGNDTARKRNAWYHRTQNTTGCF